VGPGIPAVLDNPDHPYQFPDPKPEWHHTGRRLALAQWLTRPDHPLTGRVLVNRIWQYHFGQGIVSTPDDFGSLGSLPTHPALLDWLAANFVEQGWSIKWLHQREIIDNRGLIACGRMSSSRSNWWTRCRETPRIPAASEIVSHLLFIALLMVGSVHVANEMVKIKS
jgi:hypothetical protein